MDELLVVELVDSEQVVTGIEAQQFLDIKKNALGYGEVSVREIKRDRTPQTGTFHGEAGAVKNDGDADRFLTALSNEMPEFKFHVATKYCSNWDDIVWHIDS